MAMTLLEIMDTFEKVSGDEMRERHGIRAYNGKHYVRQDRGVTVYVVCRNPGYECFFSDLTPSMSVIDSMKDTPDEALINALTWRLAPVAVMEEWTMPHLCGLKACCEDVVNWLAYNVAKAARHGLESIVYKNGYDPYDELTDECMGSAIEHMRAHAEDYGIEFVDVWTEE